MLTLPARNADLTSVTGPVFYLGGLALPSLQRKSLVL